LIEQRQQAMVGHRMNFWGRPSGMNTVSWHYKTQSWLVKRPDHGEPPLPRSVRCEVCKKSLPYFVHNVEDGVTGNFNSWPGATKHRVTLVGSRPANVPEVVCPRCGHTEEFGWGSVYSGGYSQRQYHAAKKRLEGHECPTP
jgi:hypothetical protein